MMIVDGANAPDSDRRMARIATARNGRVKRWLTIITLRRRMLPSTPPDPRVGRVANSQGLYGHARRREGVR